MEFNGTRKLVIIFSRIFQYFTAETERRVFFSEPEQKPGVGEIERPLRSDRYIYIYSDMNMITNIGFVRESCQFTTAAIALLEHGRLHLEMTP